MNYSKIKKNKKILPVEAEKLILKQENIERLDKDYEDDWSSDSTIEDISSIDENGENHDEEEPQLKGKNFSKTT